MSTDPLAQPWPGYRLGMPEDGPGAVAGWGRRIGALFIDWIASSLVASFVADLVGAGTDLRTLMPLIVFLLEVTLATFLFGASFGQLATRVAVVRLDGRRLSLLDALIRTVLICLVIPPVVFNRDNRGLHDLAVGTVAVRR